MRILVVEDEPELSNQIRNYLKSKGFDVLTAKNGKEGEHYATEYPIDAATIDIGLPDFSGIELIKRLRKKNIKIPILVLSARGSWQEKCEGLDSGADIYLVKPFVYEELLSNINALIRRTVASEYPLLKARGIELNTDTRHVTFEGKKISLTSYEVSIMECLLLNKDKPVSRTKLIDHVYFGKDEPETDTLTTFIKNIRNEIDPGRTLDIIETVSGLGYRISVNPPEKPVKT